MLRSSHKLRRHLRGDILFGPMFFMGILAAIAIPAYMDYTIRAQVSEGLNLASAAKAAVVEYYAAHGAWPANLKDAGIERAMRGKYVGAVVIKNGTVVVYFGAQANGLIAHHRLTIRPTINARQDVLWNCGFSDDMVGADPDTGPAAPHATNIAPKYLPRSCRGNSTR
jgi:type IV pilus assembly protein PilA